MLRLLLGSHWVRLLMENVLPFIGSGPLSVPSLGLHPGAWLLLMAPCRFAYPAGGSFLLSTERNQRAPRDLVPGPYQGVPPGPPKGWGKRPIPSYPCGAIRSSLRGEYPLRPFGPTGPPPGGGGMERNLVSISPWPAGHCPKGSFLPAGGNTEYGQLSGGRKRPDGVRWEQKAKLPSLPPPLGPICRGRTRNRSAQTIVDRTAQDKRGGGLEHQPQAGVLWPFSGVQGLAPGRSLPPFCRWELSSQVQRKTEENFSRRFPGKALARSVI